MHLIFLYFLLAINGNSTLSSALNSLAAVTWVDFLSRIEYFDNMGTVGKGNITCILCESTKQLNIAQLTVKIP